ncbi:MAG: metallophosphoesterase family protein [Verrucomicrobiales bacterium]
MGFRLLHYSDPHFGACDEVIAERAVEVARDWVPDLTLVSGDFTMRGRRREFAAARDWFGRLPEPRVALPGNHDVPGLNHPWDRFFRPFRRYREAMGAEEGEWELGEVGALLTLNSSTPFGWHADWSRGFLSPVQGHRLRVFFEARGGLKLLGMHHPVLASGERERALVAPMALVKGALAAAGVDLVLAGHFHQSRLDVLPLGDDQQLVVSQAPSLCSTRLKGEPNGFHFLELEQNRMRAELWRWREGDFQRVGERAFRKEGSRWLVAE